MKLIPRYQSGDKFIEARPDVIVYGIDKNKNKEQLRDAIYYKTPEVKALSPKNDRIRPVSNTEWYAGKVKDAYEGSLLQGLNNTVGTALSGASAIYGGGWLASRLAHVSGMPVSPAVRQGLSRHINVSSKGDLYSDIASIPEFSASGAIDLATSLIPVYDLTTPVGLGLYGIKQGANIYNLLQK